MLTMGFLCVCLCEEGGKARLQHYEASPKSDEMLCASIVIEFQTTQTQHKELTMTIWSVRLPQLS